MTSSRLLLFFTALTIAADAAAQRVPISIGGSPDGRRREPRARTLYDRPALSPWVGVDVGFAIPWVRCAEECGGRRYGNFAANGTAAVGVTVLSRLTLAAERSWMNVMTLGNDPTTTAQLNMATARMGTRGGKLAKVGLGKGRFTFGPTRLVQDKMAWTVGGETCGLSRIDLCIMADYSQAALGAPIYYNNNTETAQYLMRTLRAGVSGRLHLLRGHRITLPPRDPVVTTGSLP